MEIYGKPGKNFFDSYFAIPDNINNVVICNSKKNRYLIVCLKHVVPYFDPTRYISSFWALSLLCRALFASLFFIL